ncbi:alpha-glucosidase C-terminal domain-containing protein [Bradyrhizobium sp. AUGA SZCCT0177]|uniref:alpha-amylase family glycosyl hydrolase n=1 Tax=Bradyrhizobium sp. AUGA SZCCT0177 TaxID=2807665 RepID=UPI001BAC3D91|nr:alpha-amylase family glycosyl hydrolase [Bradyrhizobium sp. AUGA SZCCT0177]MBR1280968.1 alpha-glucosidase C-terminal domain-containing protein [Bradyrhizobium sp. AUGA SZCCT0177]
MTTPWWQNGVIYQIYPRSFQDTNGDGIGDLRGIAQRLDYLVSLGVDAIWISPIYPSPMVDFGYDVADYCDVDPRFGTLADFDDLLMQAHRRGLKVLLDFVPNHTSDQHPWFVESRASRGNQKRDWYIWRDAAADGGPPNNWISDFGGSAWEWDETTGQYYYHAFLKEQPDLNWRHPAVRAAMYDVMRFWFDRGVDGFRIDVLWHMVKAADFSNNPPNPAYRPEMGEMHRLLQLHSTDQPEVHRIAAEMREIADGYGARGQGERVLIGEIYLPVDRLMHYYGGERPEVHLPFNFQLIDTPWQARALAAAITGYEAALPLAGWPNWVLGNHDRPRVAAKRGQAQARVAAVLLLTLRGTPTLYYGDELGLSDVMIEASQVRDPRELREPGLALGRDPVRTPMPWDDSENAGFTTANPWLPLNADCPTRNVARMSEDPHSILTLYRRLLALRRNRRALSIGDFALLNVEDEMLAYERRHDSERLIVALNLGAQSHRLPLPDWAHRSRVLLSTVEDAALVEDGALLLGSNEAVVLEAG